METGRVLSVNSIARIEHLDVVCANLNQGFERLAQHLKAHGLAWPQVMGSAFENGRCRLIFTADDEALTTLIRTTTDAEWFEYTARPLSSITLTCYGGVSSDLPYGVLKILGTAGIRPERYLLSPNSLSLFIDAAQRVEAVRALHAMVTI